MSRTRVFKADGVQESQLCRVEAPEPRLFFISEPVAPEENDLDYGEANELAHEVRAEAILAKAREEAELILTEAQEEAERLLENARREGEQRGYREGRDKIVQEMEEDRAALEMLKIQAEEDYRKRVWESEGEILKLAMEIAETITRTSFSSQPDTWIQMVRTAISRVAGANELLIRISPEDEGVLTANLPAIREVLTESAPIRWEADSSLKPGDLWVETNIGQVDARLTQQLQAVWTAIRAGMDGP